MKTIAVTRVLTAAEVLAFDANVEYEIATAPPAGYMLKFKYSIVAKLSGTAVGANSSTVDFVYSGETTSLAQISNADFDNIMDTGTTVADWTLHTEHGTDDLDIAQVDCVAKGISIKNNGNVTNSDCTLQVTVVADLIQIGR